MCASLRGGAALLVLLLLVVACGGKKAPGDDVLVLAPGATPMPANEPDDAAPPDGQPAINANVPATDRAIVFNQLAIWDPQAGDIPAVTFLAPAGWDAEGSVTWTHEWSRLAHLHTRVSDPESGLTIEWLPVQDFVWFESSFNAPIGGNYMGKAFVPPITDPAEFVASFWIPGGLAHLSEATLVTVEEVPAVAEEFARHFGGTPNAFAYKLRYEYIWNGEPWEEEVSFALLFTSSQGITSWYVQFATAVRARLGGIAANQSLVSTVLGSRTTTPEWEAVYRIVQQLFQQGQQQQVADTAAFGRALAQYRAETQALQEQVTAERQAAQDRVADLRQEVLAGVETYIDPVNQALVQLPTGWQNYWVNDKGQYVVADAGVDPNALFGPGWQQMVRRP